MVAIKTIWKNQFSATELKYVKQEIDILLDMEVHSNVIVCHEIYEDNHCIHFVFDLVKGGDLFDYCFVESLNKKLDEPRAAFIFNQILEAIHACHSQGIVHRDIKPENFLIDTQNNAMQIKMIDFGFAARFGEAKMTDIVGSVQYMAPELIEGNYDHKVDIWAAGVMLYAMLEGRPPFDGRNDEEIAEKIRLEEPDFSNIRWKNISSDAANMVKLMLSKNPRDRPNVEELKNHKCYTN